MEIFIIPRKWAILDIVPPLDLLFVKRVCAWGAQPIISTRKNNSINFDVDPISLHKDIFRSRARGFSRDTLCVLYSSR